MYEHLLLKENNFSNVKKFLFSKKYILEKHFIAKKDSELYEFTEMTQKKIKQNYKTVYKNSIKYKKDYSIKERY